MNPLRRCLLVAGAAGWVVPARALGAELPRKGALVVGNGAYKTLPLRHAVSDAREMRRALAGLGFEVKHSENLGWEAFLQALADFTRDAERYDVRLFYYAGHGMQVRGKNYLNPVDEMPASEQALRSRAVELDTVIAHLSKLSTGVSIVIVDACRSNPFIGLHRRTRAAPPQELRRRDAPRGMVVAFSSSPERRAEDGAGKGGSTFTRRLAAEMQVPGLPIEQVLKRVRAAVDTETNQSQQPWMSTNLVGEFCMRPRTDGSCG